MMDSEFGNLSLEGLRSQLEEKEENLQRAAQIGKALLEENQELNGRIEDMGRAHAKKLEECEQEKYSLQLKLDHKTNVETWYNEELASLKQQLADNKNSQQDNFETEKQQLMARISKLTRQTEAQQSEIEEAQNKEFSLQEKIIELESLLQEQLNQTEVVSKSFLSDEIGQLQQEVCSLQNDNTGLKSQVIGLKTELHQACAEGEGLKVKLAARDEELEELRCEHTSLANALEQSRVEVLDLKAQMEALRMETSGHRKKGNSLFSEVEDRRVKAEQKLISLKVEFDRIKEKYELEKQQNHKYKMQMVALFQMSSGRVDGEHVQRLESQLAQAREEIRALYEEREKNQKKEAVQMNRLAEFTTDKSGDQDYVQYLIAMLKGKEEELEKIQKEIKSKNLLLLDYKNRATTQERKIFEVEREKDKIRSQNMKLIVQVEELKMKYEPDSLKKKGSLTVKRVEKIPIPEEEEEVKITETSCVQDMSMNQSKSVSHTLNQSKPLLHNETKQPLVEKEGNKDIQSKCSFTKKKTVSISDEVMKEDLYLDDSFEEEENKIPVPQRQKPKGKKVMDVRYVTKENMKYGGSINDCKQQ